MKEKVADHEEKKSENTFMEISHRYASQRCQRQKKTSTQK